MHGFQWCLQMCDTALLILTADFPVICEGNPGEVNYKTIIKHSHLQSTVTLWEIKDLYSNKEIKSYFSIISHNFTETLS